VATVDRVDPVINRPLHHREAQDTGSSEQRRLPGVRDDRVRRNQVPVSHGVRARDRGRREGDEPQRDEKWQDWCFFELSW
jgi:hypothetical protein